MGSGFSRTVLAALVAAVLAVTPSAGQVPFGLVPRDRVAQLGPGKLLVAAKELREPNFAQSVILLLDHSADGAMGLVINERTTVPLANVFEGLVVAGGHQATAYLGGPVAPTGALGLARSATAVAGARALLAEVYLVQTRALMERWLTTEADANRFRVYLGYAGWGPGQLERETEMGTWLVLDADADSVFDADPDTAWGRQLQRTEWRQASR